MPPGCLQGGRSGTSRRTSFSESMASCCCSGGPSRSATCSQGFGVRAQSSGANYTPVENARFLNAQRTTLPLLHPELRIDTSYTLHPPLRMDHQYTIYSNVSRQLLLLGRALSQRQLLRVSWLGPQGFIVRASGCRGSGFRVSWLGPRTAFRVSWLQGNLARKNPHPRRTLQ